MKRRSVLMAGGSVIGFFGIGPLIDFSRTGTEKGDPWDSDLEEYFYILDHSFEAAEREIHVKVGNRTGRNADFTVRYAFLDGCSTVSEGEFDLPEVENHGERSFIHSVDSDGLESRYWWPYSIELQDTVTSVSKTASGGPNRSHLRDGECETEIDNDTMVLGHPPELDDVRNDNDG